MSGRVRSRGERLDKAGARIPADAPLEVVAGPRHVSRGGVKLEGALAEFRIPAEGRDALDVGASTGGFTQVLLEAGAARVVALDVGHGQLDSSLRSDPRVVPLEGLNARYLRPSDLPFLPSLVVIDVSFISLEHVLPCAWSCVAPEGDLVALIKPQFEVGRGHVGPGGIVRDPALHREVLTRIVRFARALGAEVHGLARSVLPGAEGNVEFFLHLATRPGGSDPGGDDERIEALVRKTAS
jgi:23S rRNA (cytidine1920-2'-O)/16S rRNA (cytidine1409-2'-O)-methyltransferase